MDESADSVLDVRLKQLESRLRRLQVCSAIGALVLTGAIYLALHSRVPYDNSNHVLRVRGVVIEDAQGRARVLLGAPVPSVPERRRQDNAVGLVVLGEAGADRVALAAPVPAPQSKGVAVERIGDGAGIVIDDKNGNERGGFAVIDSDNRAVIGLDYPEGAGEAIHLVVLPSQGPGLNIHDTKGLIRAGLVLRNDATAELYGLNPRDKTSMEMGLLKLNPYSAKNVVIEPNEQAFSKVLDGH